MHLDFSRARGKVYWTSVRAYIRRSKAMLTGALIANMATPSTPKALQLLSRCPNLEYLELRDTFAGADFYDLFKNSKRLRTLITSADAHLSDECSVKLLNTLPLIERIEIHNIKSPRSCSLQWPRELPNLKRITVGTQDYLGKIINPLVPDVCALIP
jgi:F-box/TPR repeat protein Pof3